MRLAINYQTQVPAALWRAGILDDMLKFPAAPVDETACSDGSTRLQFSWDPNDIQGLPERSHIWPTQPLEFLIRFENLPTATLPARTVTVTLPIDSNLDWSAIKTIGSSHPQTMTVRADHSQHTVSWVFRDLNLPPNTSPPAGEGWVRLRLAPIPTLRTGDQIAARAGIYFDHNPPVWTNTITYTIDLEPPAPDLALAGVADGWPLVRLSAQDNPGGAGVQNLALYYSRDLLHWSKGMALTATVPAQTLSGVIPFTPQGGHYWLRAAAADLANNISPLSAAMVEATVPYHIYFPVMGRAMP